MERGRNHQILKMELFDQGKTAMEKGRYDEARDIYEKILHADSSCVEAWNNLGVTFCELFQFKKSLGAYSRIDIELRTSKTWYNIALAHFFSSDFDQALDNIQKSIDTNPDNAAALDLKGKIQIEQEDYKNAMISFNQAFIVSGNLKFLLWQAYSLHLFSEFSAVTDEPTHKRQLNLLIRKLERLERLALHMNNNEVHEQALYFLGCCYSRYKDSFTAVDKLGECLNANTNPEISRVARNLLIQIWNFQIRPPWWTWWLNSPSFLNRTLKQFVFGMAFTCLLLIISLFIFHPFIFMLFPQIKTQVDWNLYLFVIGLLLIILVSPSIEQVKTKDMEVKMHSPPPLDSFPAPARLEDQLGSMKNDKISRIKKGISGLFELTDLKD